MRLSATCTLLLAALCQMLLCLLLTALWWQENTAAFVEPRKGAAHARPRRAARATPVMVGPLASYRAALEIYTLPTKALTNAALFGVSDIIAQVRSGGEAVTADQQGAGFDALETIDLARVGESC